MSDQDDDKLGALFDKTAPEPEREQLERLARFAAQVPSRAVPAWKRWLRRAPALGLALAGAAALAMWLGAAPLSLDGAFPNPSVTMIEEPFEDEAPIEAEDPLALVVDEDDEFVLDDPLAALEIAGGESPLALLDLLALPEGDEELDSWSDAYERAP
jgi:hypothetical protein